MISLSRNKYAIVSALFFGVLTLIFFFGDAVPFIRVTFGDYLVVMFMFTGLLFLFPKLKSIIAGVIIFAIAVTVELMQMGLIQRFFDTDSPLVEATLGSTFDPHDIIAYFLGVLSIAIIDFILRRNKVKSN